MEKPILTLDISSHMIEVNQGCYSQQIESNSLYHMIFRLSVRNPTLWHRDLNTINANTDQEYVQFKLTESALYMFCIYHHLPLCRMDARNILKCSARFVNVSRWVEVTLFDHTKSTQVDKGLKLYFDDLLAVPESLEFLEPFPTNLFRWGDLRSVSSDSLDKLSWR